MSTDAPKAEINPLLKKFNLDYNAHHDLRRAIALAVNHFLTDAEEGPLKQELFQYLETVKTVKFGRIVHKRQFTNLLPTVLIQFFDTVALIEQSAFCAPNALLSDCEIKMATGQFKPGVVYTQTARIETAIAAKQFEERYLFKANSKVIELVAKLYGAFAELIFESTNLPMLKSQVETIFNDSLAKDLPKIKGFRNEVDAQIEYLEENEFFDNFYQAKSLAEKYDIVVEFYQFAKAKGTNTAELKGTMSYLQKQILNSAYKSCERKKSKLMDSRDATTHDVFQYLREWIDAGAWRSHGDGELKFELEALFESEKKQYEAWEKLGKRIQELRNPNRVEQMPMIELFCMKFAGDPSQDPIAELENLNSKVLLQSLSSPKKRRTTDNALMPSNVSNQKPNSDSVTGKTVSIYNNKDRFL